MTITMYSLDALCVFALLVRASREPECSADAGETAQLRKPKVDPVMTDRYSLAQPDGEREAGDQAADAMSQSAALAYRNEQFATAERLWRARSRTCRDLIRTGCCLEQCWLRSGRAGSLEGSR
jgi:hypothetical protein